MTYHLTKLRKCKYSLFIIASTCPADTLNMKLSNTACISGISQSASSCASCVLSSMPWDGCADGQWVQWNPENNKRYMLYQLHTQAYVWYIHSLCIYHVFTDVTWKLMLAADLYWCVCIYMLYICYITSIYNGYSQYIPCICRPPSISLGYTQSIPNGFVPYLFL